MQTKGEIELPGRENLVGNEEICQEGPASVDRTNQSWWGGPPKRRDSDSTKVFAAGQATATPKINKGYKRGESEGRSEVMERQTG